MKSTATTLDDRRHHGEPVSPHRRGRKLKLAGAACTLGAAAALTLGPIHHTGERSVRAPVQTVHQGTHVSDSVAALSGGPDGVGDASLAATNAAEDHRTAIELDTAAANTRLHDMREEREAARTAGANGTADDESSLAGPRN